MEPLEPLLMVPVFVMVFWACKILSATEIVPLAGLVSAPVTVLEAPSCRVLLFCNVPEKIMLPEVEPMEPVEVTLPVKVRAPEVEVTVVPDPRVEAPVTVRLKAAALKVPPPVVVKAPEMVPLLVTRVAVPLALITDRLKKVTPVTFCVA